MSRSRPRAVIVGSGSSGSTVARLLARSGHYDVVVVEKGRNYFTGLGGDPSQVTTVFANDELNYEIDKAPLISQDPFLEPRSFRAEPSAGKRTFVGDVDNLATTVGGSFAHADVKARRFREVDFMANSLLEGTADRPAIPGTSYSDWPITYQLIEPFYAVAEEIVGVQGPARRVGGRIVNPNPYESPRSTPFALPPGVQQLNSLLPADAARRLGYTPAPVPTGAVSRPYLGRQPCNDCGFCNNYGCPNGAKAGGVWQLNDAMVAGATLISQANVIRIEWSPPAKGQRARATGVTYIDAEGRQNTLAADLVVLANTPIESTRLCLQSQICKPPNENNVSQLLPTATEPSGLLGRNLMLHLQTIVLALMDQDIHSYRGRTSTQTLDAFAGPGPSPADFDPDVLMGGLLEIGGNLNPVGQANYLTPLGIGARHKLLMQLAPLVNHISSFTLQGQDMPQLTNYVDLDPDIVDVWGQQVPRITYKNHPYEVAAAAFYIPKMMEIMANVGGPGSAFPTVKPIFIASLNTTVPAVVPGSVDAGASPVIGATPFSDVPADRHIMGTHRMALDPDHGVCDPYGRMWAFDNLFVTGGALYVTAPGFNVTLTMYALSYWVGAAIVAGVGGAGSYTTGCDGYLERHWGQMLNVIARLDGDTMIARAINAGQLIPLACR
jgi:choline dehydrogenase-like flavoprotein